ncbi:LPS assembly lipoprotein LptE [Sphingomonas endophytica]|uniref:Secreted (Periplasmic)-like protein n=1 Tax=Sphingomonas endophytica TaxID=869719 RepID=A0A147I823_9SPHN|nr:LPS assembly lipoprotein LptE [Sphingomonas endophytica]KTT75273.1 secreted (periplasmic)-like protein [Sphingomonas endophytica]
MGRLLAALVAVAVPLSGCGLKPLYTGGGGGPIAATLGEIAVAPIEGKAGWLVSGALRERLAALGGGTARYRLNVRLDDRIIGLAARSDDSIARERRTLRARYQLIDDASGTVVLDATAGSDAGIDVVGSEYATIAAESTALERLSETIADQIVARLALYARRTQPTRP